VRSSAPLHLGKGRNIMPHCIREPSRARPGRIASALTILTLAGLLLPGCIAVGGTEQHNQPTLGHQLIDLKQARDTGAIDEDQYQNAKHELLAKS
jgi:hypothetical protein